MKVVLPLPFMPTTASRSPTLKVMLRWRRAYCSLPGYRNETSRNSTVYWRSLRFSVVRLPLYILLGRAR